MSLLIKDLGGGHCRQKPSAEVLGWGQAWQESERGRKGGWPEGRDQLGKGVRLDKALGLLQGPTGATGELK